MTARILGILLALFAAQLSAQEPSSSVSVRRAGKPGQPMMLGTSVMDQDRNLLVRSLGFFVSQTDSDHLTVNESAPGRWDWAGADAGLEAMRKIGMKWQYFPHFNWAPDWYRKTNQFVPSIGLRSRRKLACISLWSPDIERWFDHGYAALANHYGRGNNRLFAIYLGIHGDFGETIFPMGWHPDEKKRFGEEGTALPDYWCGDDYARADFRRFVRAKYASLHQLNKTWGTQYNSFDAVDYPDAAYKSSADVAGTAATRRHWLDFVQWYFDSMTNFTGKVCQIARKYFPQSLLVLPVGGGSENLMYGQDTTAIPKIARQYGVHIRSTHGGFRPFPENYSAMIKRIATPCKVYKVPHWLEPPGTISPEQEVSRIMEALSCGNWGFWDWGGNPVGAADVFRKYAAFFTRENPVVDVALFYPTTDHRLTPQIDYPPRLNEIGAQLRDVMDYDIVDEELVADDALSFYRVLVWLEGGFVEEKTLIRIAAWVKRGGVLVKLGADSPRTVEGDISLSSDLLGLTSQTTIQKSDRGQTMRLEVKNGRFLSHLAAGSERQTDATASELGDKANVLCVAENRPSVWAVPHGKGWVIVWAGSNSTKAVQATFYELMRDIVYNLSRLDPTKRNALEIDREWDGVYATLLANHEVILYNSNSDARVKTIGGATITIPPKSLRSAQAPNSNQE